MSSKKFALLAVVVFMLGCIPAIASAAPTRLPSYNQVVAGSTKVIGASLDPMTITLTFPNGAKASTTSAGGGASWTIPVSGSLKESDVIRLDYTSGGDSGWFYITVAPAGTNLDGSNANNNANNSGDSSVVTDNSATTSSNGTPATTTTTTNNANTGVPATGDARPLFAVAGGLFLVGLFLAFLIRALWLRRQQA